MANRDTVIVTAGRGLTRVVKVDAWSILLYDVRGERIVQPSPTNKDIAMERRRKGWHRTGKRVCHRVSAAQNSCLTFVRATVEVLGDNLRSRVVNSGWVRMALANS